MIRPEIPHDVIVTFEHIWGVDYYAWVRTMAQGNGLRPPAQNGVTAGDDVRAYVNSGRWIAECPDCHSAQVISDKTRDFWCLHCGNASIDFMWRHVRMPRDRKPIEDTLIRRPAARSDRALTRNWLTDETVEDLEAENVTHGVG